MNRPNRVRVSHVPFVRFLLALLLGIGVGYLVPPQPPLYIAAWVVLALVLTAFITVLCATKLRQYRYYGLLGLFVQIVWCMVGFILTLQPDPRIDRSHFSHFESSALVGYVIDEPVIRGGHVRFPFAVTQVYDNDGFTDVSGKLMLTVNKGDSLPSLSFKYGDELIIPAGYEEVRLPYNPGELDYRAFLAGKNIWHQDYLRAKQVKNTGRKGGSPVIAFALALRQRMVVKFSTYILNRDAYSVASTLILGYRAELSDTLLQSFSNTGTIHVLSVSGMHVVIVFWLLSKLLWWMDRNRNLRLVKFMVLLLAVWGYALLTGFSPSVLRASIMIGFVMAASLFAQQNRVYNSIAASAFFLLLYDPKFIADIGFQLSYLAVLGIVFLYPLMRAAFSIRNGVAAPVVNYTWMSVTAQTGAGPLAAYYFHQFPLYFLPANLFIVLPATGIMYLGFMLLLIPPGQLASWIGSVLETLISVTNVSLGYIEQLPLASIQGIWMTWWEGVLIYLLIVAIAIATVIRNKRWVYIALGCVVLLVCSSFLATLQRVNRQEIVCFNVGRSMAIGLISERGTWLYSSLASIDNRIINYSVLPKLGAHAPVETIHFIPQDSSYHDHSVYAKEGVLQFNNARLMVYEGTHTYDGFLDVDILVVRNNPDTPLKTMLKIVNCKQLVIDGSNFDSTISRLVAEAEGAGIPAYVLKNNFAYVWEVETSVQ